MTTKTYKKQHIAKGIATKMTKDAPEGVRYMVEALTDEMFYIVEVKADAPKKRGPKPGPDLSREDLIAYVRNYAAMKVEFEEDTIIWSDVLNCKDHDLKLALGRSKKPAGAVWAVEQAWKENLI